MKVEHVNRDYGRPLDLAQCHSFHQKWFEYQIRFRTNSWRFKTFIGYDERNPHPLEYSGPGNFDNTIYFTTNLYQTARYLVLKSTP